MKDPQFLKDFLDQKVIYYNTKAFIGEDPISIPHRFTLQQDVEISGFFAAIFSWGQRVTIINKAKELMALFSDAPYDFIKNHQPADLKNLSLYKHRTFNGDDLLYFIFFLKQHYKKNNSLENAFFNQPGMRVEDGLNYFKKYFFSFEHLQRTQKHIAAPSQHSACKRLNMFLRWMVRKDEAGVDFGIWNQIAPKELICPLDVHVGRGARILGLLQSVKNDWQAAVELSETLSRFDKKDPVKYDFALFNLGVTEQK
jgi:uncharacterized protein (TIGR02757 family)